MTKCKAVILDRDGVLIEDKDFAYKIEDLEILPGVIKGLKMLQQKFKFFIVTNQSGIGRGYYTEEDFHKFNNHLIELLKIEKIKILKTFFCPHLREDSCDCRKPKTKFVEEIVDEFNVDIKKSWMFGDHPSDIQFGINGGCKTVFLTTGHGDRHVGELKSLNIDPTIISNNFLSAVQEILNFV
ncbi:MAG: D-glycero-alpha-D-manno-heptose-1,7-bisphosphate 7-phosphatase [Promethearchaeota archaeon]|jgi:D-glycero-D-manno-heptose 1,7-bisphosphate phosphatase